MYASKLHMADSLGTIFPQTKSILIWDLAFSHYLTKLKSLCLKNHYHITKWILIDKYDDAKSMKHSIQNDLKKKDIGSMINILFSSKTETKPNKEGWGKKENRN